VLPFESPCAYYEGRRDSSRSSDQALQTSPFTPSSAHEFIHALSSRSGAWPLVASWRSNLAALLGATAVLRPPLQL